MNLTHIDTCTADYLTDHHHREGEYLVGVPVDGLTTYAEVMDGLMTFAFDEAAVTGVIRETFAHVKDMHAPFDPSLPDDLDIMPQAWFLFTWDAERTPQTFEEWLPDYMRPGVDPATGI